jgi:glycosyltransferase involved in cell wall biosynthesis
MTNKIRTIDFVVPSYDEEENIQAMYEKIKSAFENIGVKDFKIIFVENGSTDNSQVILNSLQKKDKRVVGLSLSRNFGPQGAIYAGLSKTNAKYVSIMDGDQQDPPEDAAKMYQKAVNENIDVIYAVRKTRKESILRKIGFKLFYRVWSAFSNIKVPLDAGEFSVMSYKVVKTILSAKEIHRFNRGLRSWAGYSQAPYYHDRPERIAGKNKFNIFKDIVLGLEALTSFSLLPIRMIFFVGLLMAGLSFLLMLVNFIAITLNFFNYESLLILLPKGIKVLNLFYLFFQSITFIFIGIIGEYIGKIYEQTKNRPAFIIDKVIGDLD